MFEINSDRNRLSPIKSRSFRELGFREREHLQEWIAHQPDSLGEDLLIIQKEFDGFDDTRERLDLLALDKEGNLVIIENKLDDSGRDVVWQALKYASYCASLTKSQIVEIYNEYLFKYGSEVNEALPRNASDAICEFLSVADLDEVKLNIGSSQRIILVAANFRKEVTSTALWLLGQGISIQCFKVTPYSSKEQLLINIDQIIPPPETKELIISMSAKEAEEKNTEEVRKNRHLVRLEYWEQLLSVFATSDCNLFDNRSPTKDHWLDAGSGVGQCRYRLIFSKKELRAELVFERSVAEQNDYLFDQFFMEKDTIEAEFGNQLQWLVMDGRKSCRIQIKCSVEGFEKANWPRYIEWHLKHIMSFEKTLKERLYKAKLNLEKGWKSDS